MERLLYAGTKGNLYLFCGYDPATGYPNLTAGQLTWWTACRVAEAEELKETSHSG